MRRGLMISGLLIAATFSTAGLSAAEKVSAKEGVGLLKKYCIACHGLEQEVPNFHIMDRKFMTTRRGGDAKNLFLEPGNPEASYLWTRVGVHKDMPPDDRDVPMPTDLEREKIRQWIEEGATFPEVQERPFISETDLVKAIVVDLTRMPEKDRQFQRYFSLANLHNNPAVTDEDLRITRAGFVKFINSVSRSGRLIFPVLIDAPAQRPAEGAIFRLDLRSVNWDIDLWKSVVKLYPYGLVYNGTAENMALLKQFFGSASFDRIPYVRVDWFITTASHGDAYHNLLGIPKTLAELEKQLGITSKQDFDNDRIRRAGFAGSAVSRNFRLVDRFQGTTSQYLYRSYDFGRAHGNAVLVKFPLGPKDLAGKEFEEFAFEEDGGELIWSLPNGMQAYMIIDKEHKRLDEAPVKVVRDLGEIGGSPVVVNGISCIGCHKHGMRLYVDRIRGWSAVTGKAQTKVESLFAARKETEDFLADDQKLFMNALERVMLPYVKDEDGFATPIAAYPEPINFVARNYRRDLTLSEISYELGFRKPDDTPLRGAAVRALGLLPIIDGGKLPRDTWETRAESPQSLFQNTALELDLAEPINPN